MKRDVILITISVILILALGGLFIYDLDPFVIARTTYFDMPSDAKVVQMVKKGSMFDRNYYEAKVSIDHDSANELVTTIAEAYGFAGMILNYGEYESMASSTFSESEIVPEVEVNSNVWLMAYETSDGSDITFVIASAGPETAYLYIYYSK